MFSMFCSYVVVAQQALNMRTLHRKPVLVFTCILLHYLSLALICKAEKVYRHVIF